MLKHVTTHLFIKFYNFPQTQNILMYIEVIEIELISLSLIYLWVYILIEIFFLSLHNYTHA